MNNRKNPNQENSEPGYVEMLEGDPIFAQVAGAGRYQTTIGAVINLCKETNPRILQSGSPGRG